MRKSEERKACIMYAHCETVKFIAQGYFAIIKFELLIIRVLSSEFRVVRLKNLDECLFQSMVDK